jgi:DNA-binding CsgD family transcriptional regulator
MSRESPSRHAFPRASRIPVRGWPGQRTRRAVPASLLLGLSSNVVGGPTVPRATELTAIERDVLCDAARGLNNIQIGAKQFRSPETIRTHMKHIMFKLNARNRAHAVAIAYDTGIFRCRLPHLPKTQAIPRLMSPPGNPRVEPGQPGRAASTPARHGVRQRRGRR